MRQLSIHDLRALNESILTLNSDSREGNFPERLSMALASLISCELVAVECFEISGVWFNRLLGDRDGLIAKYFSAFLRLSNTHPLFPAFLAGRMHKEAVRISDVTNRRHLRNLAIYDEFLKPIGVDVQIGMSFSPHSGSNEVLILSRKGMDFTLKEKQRLSAFLPHIESARTAASDHGNCSPRVPGKSNRDSIVSRLQRRIGLTYRESELLWWLSRGKNDKDIASICGISRRTVQKHCENIYKKCGVSGRTGAVILALEGSNNSSVST